MLPERLRRRMAESRPEPSTAELLQAALDEQPDLRARLMVYVEERLNQAKINKIRAMSKQDWMNLAVNDGAINELEFQLKLYGGESHG